MKKGADVFRELKEKYRETLLAETDSKYLDDWFGLRLSDNLSISASFFDDWVVVSICQDNPKKIDEADGLKAALQEILGRPPYCCYKSIISEDETAYIFIEKNHSEHFEYFSKMHGAVLC